MTGSQKAIRRTLGDYMSTVCFKAAITGLEEALGEKAAAISLIAAGRKRGKQLAEQLNLSGQTTISLEAVASKLRYALGQEGTRLCLLEKLENCDGVIKAYLRETVCSSGEIEGSPRQCTYTLGAIQGFLESYLSQRLRGKHTESVLRGAEYDVLEFESLT